MFLPASRLSRAGLLSISRALLVDDLMWSLKDLCSSSSLIDRDISTSIRPKLTYATLLPTPVPDEIDFPRQIHFAPLLHFSSPNIHMLIFAFLYYLPLSGSVASLFQCPSPPPSLCFVGVQPVHSSLLQQASVQ